MNIHSEYCFLPEGAVLPDETVKVLGITPEGFYFLIHQQNVVQYALLGSCPSDDDHNIIQEISTRKPEWRIGEINNVLLLPESSVLIPNDLLNRSTEKELIGFCQVLPADYHLMKTKVDWADASLVSVVSTKTADTLKNVSQHLRFEDLAAAWLNKISQQGIHAFISASRFYISVLNDGKLQLFNSFSYTDKNDFLYYLLGAVKSCNIEPSTTQIAICGEISPASPLAQSLENYFGAVLYDAVPSNGSPEERMLSSMLFPLF